MESSTDLLKEITVTGNRINSTNKLDKQTYSADQFEASKGGSAIDALRNQYQGLHRISDIDQWKACGHRCTDYLKSIAC